MQLQFADPPASLDDLEGAAPAMAVSRRRSQRRRAVAAATNGPRPGRCCTSTRSSCPSSTGPGTGPPASAPSSTKTRNAGKVKIIGVIDDHTRLAYCEIHGAETAITVSAHAAPRRPVDARAGLRARPGGDERQREVLRHQPRLPRHARRARRPPHPHPALHAALERQDRTLLRHTLDSEWAHGRVWPNSPRATAPWHPSSATTTAAGHTQPPAAAPPSPAFSKTVSRTSSPPRSRRG